MTKIIEIKNLNLYYGDKKAINDCNLSIEKNMVTAIIGPSGCGKSTLLRTINRMNDFIDTFKIEGEISYNDENIYSSKIDSTTLRKSIGMVFQKPNPFPKSIYKNITWGPLMNGFDGDQNQLVEDSLKNAGLWKEVKDRLDDSALSLSGGQQQRLCIARAIAMKPDVILMDEPCSALDPKSTATIETLIKKLRKDYTILIVTHNMQQAARVSDFTLFLYEGNKIEYGKTEEIFKNPQSKQTEDYITGRFG
ncbi:MAG: phosphate ABC transporter ATP-binding protein [Candidatus Marinimicrobia bacterium]|nr:phosphate ABC transporter ATP-binding protein [Candidatus Neomarinimicrobiota bacterium]|tara:strand:+ start:7020 stop:7769 length:750 start_codon:yes stop_codon:yes gene_type:complete